LPPLEDLQVQALLAQTGNPSSPPHMVSTLEPYRAVVTQLHSEGVEGAALWQATAARVRERGYPGSLWSVYRFLHHLRPPRSEATVRVEREPGEEAPVDFGFAGRMIDPQTGTLRRTWAFVMTLSWSRYQYGAATNMWSSSSTRAWRRGCSSTVAPLSIGGVSPSAW
jgi:transposase